MKPQSLPVPGSNYVDRAPSAADNLFHAFTEFLFRDWWEPAEAFPPKIFSFPRSYGFDRPPIFVHFEQFESFTQWLAQQDNSLARSLENVVLDNHHQARDQRPFRTCLQTCEPE